jgi:hypothetical protein
MNAHDAQRSDAADSGLELGVIGNGSYWRTGRARWRCRCSGRTR